MPERYSGQESPKYIQQKFCLRDEWLYRFIHLFPIYMLSENTIFARSGMD